MAESMVEQGTGSGEQSTNARQPEIVYVLQNPPMPGYVKIGRTADLARRMSDLDVTAVPVPFECIYAALVSDAVAWETTLHTVFEEKRINKRREFFSADIVPKVVQILETAQIENVTQTAPVVVGTDEEDARTRIARRERFDFEMLGIAEGTELEFVQGEGITCTVVSQKPPRVDFKGTTLTLSNATAQALSRESSAGLQGPLYWKYQGAVLTEIRRERESGEEEDQ